MAPATAISPATAMNNDDSLQKTLFLPQTDSQEQPTETAETTTPISNPLALNDTGDHQLVLPTT